MRSQRRPGARRLVGGRGSRGLALWLLATGLVTGASGREAAAKSKHDDKAKAASKGQVKGKKSLDDEAAALRQRALGSLVSKDFAGAYTALADSYRLSPEAQTLYLLGQIAWQTGKTVAAQDLMRRFLADPASEKDAPARAEAERVLEQPRPPSGEVLVLGERGSLLLVDDRVVGMLPLVKPLLLSAGEHKVTLELNQRRLEGPVKVLPGRTAELRFTLGSDAVVARVVPALVWVPTWRGVPQAAEKVLVQAVEQAVQKQRMSVVPRSIALAQAPKLADCLDTLPCLDQLITTNEADYALSSTVEATGDLVRADWRLKLGLVEVNTGDFAATLEETCEKCTADQAGAALDQAVGKLLDKGAARARGQLEVLSEPPGADVLTTERKLGQTPYQRAAFTGRYEIAVKAKGYALAREPVVVEEGKKATLRVKLLPEDAPPPRPAPPPVAVTPPPPPPVAPAPVPTGERAPRPTWRVATGAALLGVGVLLAGYGAAGVYQDGRCAPAEDGGCSRRYDSGAAGGGFLGAGLVVALGGAVLVALPGPRRATGKVALAPLGGGAVLQWAGSY
ncbi:MAG: PEGA domain-containing protein [Polyangia bacterium]